MIGHNGAHGCKDCLIEGAHVVNKKGYSHYYSFEATKNAEDRTDEDSISNAREAIEKNKTVNGIKGATFFMALPIFSIRDGIVVDYMHGILLGVGKTLLNLWFEVGDHKNYYKAHKTYPAYFVGHDIDDVDERLLKMQPPDFISRRPRKIDGNIGHLKANELRSWILYYALPCLKDILPETYWNHFSLLVEGLHIILSDSVSRDDITNARKYFRTFYEDFAKLYEHNLGKCGLNVHNLYHLCDYVEWWGPAWCWSCFGFENLNGEILKRVHGTKNTTKQILLRFAAIKEVRETLLSSHTRDVLKSFLRSLSYGGIKRNWVYVSKETFVSGCLEKDVYSCYRRGSLIVKGTRYKRSTKAINSVVIALVNSQAYAFQVDFFTVDEKSVSFHGKLLQISNQSIAPKVMQTSKLRVVEGKSEEIYVFNADTITEKLLLIDGNNDFQCISRLPNHFESD